ncbi:hypothetical protein R6Q57_029582 [Mikania cordata]
MVHISDELIIFEILTRVPARIVGRSNCVCKKWKALLLTPQFIKIHCSRSLIAANQRVVLVDYLTCSAHPINFQSGDYGPDTILSFPFNNVTIYSHLDGLLCVRLNHTSELALWNPVTGSYKLLSTHDRHGFFENNVDAVGLYIDAYDDYKVLHIKRRFGVFYVNAYSRRFESWTNIPFLTRSKCFRKVWMIGINHVMSIPDKNFELGFNLIQISKNLYKDTTTYTINYSHLSGESKKRCLPLSYARLLSSFKSKESIDFDTDYGSDEER